MGQKEESSWIERKRVPQRKPIQCRGQLFWVIRERLGVHATKDERRILKRVSHVIIIFREILDSRRIVNINGTI
jgi:hypothetical protein